MASIIGSIFSFDCRKFTCCKRLDSVNTNDDDYRNIYETAQNSNILILPATNIETLKSLFPETNHVALWNILIVGKDKEYILVKLNGDLQFSGCDRLVNNKYADKMPKEIRQLLDSIWEKTLLGKNLQFIMIFHGKAYLCNSYCFKNENLEIIGAICFLRDMENMQDNQRLSVDGNNMMDIPLPIPRQHLESLLENKPLNKN